MGAYAFAEIAAIAGQDHLRRYPLPGALPRARLLLHHTVHVRHSTGTRAVVNLHEFGYVLIESGHTGIPSVSRGGRPAEPESFIVQAGIVPGGAERPNWITLPVPSGTNSFEGFFEMTTVLVEREVAGKEQLGPLHRSVGKLPHAALL